MKIRFTITTCFILTFLAACYSARVATFTDAFSEELAQVILPLGSDDKPLGNLDQFYSGLLTRLNDSSIDRFRKVPNPIDELRRTVKVEVMETKGTTLVQVGVIERIHSPRSVESTHILDAALAELRLQLPQGTQYRTLSRRN